MIVRTALPGPMIDLIRDGVSSSNLRAGGDKAVFNALVRTAASAHQRGYKFPDWAALLDEARSNLGRQARIKSTGKERPRPSYERTLRNAWEKAARWLITAPPAFTREDVLARIATVVEFVGDADVALNDAERAVLAAACEVATRNGTDRPALPRRALVEATGLGERTVRTTLDRLDHRGLLILDTPGRSGSATSGRRRAHLYRLPTQEAIGAAYLYRGTRSVGPPAQIYGTPSDPTDGTPAQIYGTPRSTDPNQEELAMVTVTISAPDAEALAAALQVLHRDQAVAVQHADRPQLVVVPPESRPASPRRRRRPA